MIILFSLSIEDDLWYAAVFKDGSTGRVKMHVLCPSKMQIARGADGAG
jgi:hypothetical protein